MEDTSESPQQSTAEEWRDDIPYLQILDICCAYESGFGHGLADRGFANPYEKGSAGWHGYAIGVDLGKSRAKLAE